MAGPAVQAAASAEEDAEAVAAYKTAIKGIEALGKRVSPDDKAIIEGYKAKIDLITKPKAPVLEPLPMEQYKAASVAVESSKARNETLLKVSQCIQQRIADDQADLERVVLAITLAHREQQAAEMAFTAAQLLLAPAATGPTAAHVAPAVPAQAVFLETLTQQMEAPITPDAELRVRQQMAASGTSWGCTSEADFPYAKFLSAVLAGLATPTAAQTPAAQPPMAASAATAPIAPQAPAVRVAGVPKKVESLMKQSEAQAAKVAHAEMQRTEQRETTREAARQEAAIAAAFEEAGAVGSSADH